MDRVPNSRCNTRDKQYEESKSEQWRPRSWRESRGGEVATAQLHGTDRTIVVLYFHGAVILQQQRNNAMLPWHCPVVAIAPQLCQSSAMMSWQCHCATEMIVPWQWLCHGISKVPRHCHVSVLYHRASSCYGNARALQRDQEGLHKHISTAGEINERVLQRYCGPM